MLSKLLKKDFISTSRFFLPLILGYVGASILGKILLEMILSMGHNTGLLSGIAVDSNLYNILVILGVIYMALFFFYVAAYFILTSVFIVYDFYKTMVSDQAYLTHTLPAKTTTLIHSKVLVSAAWQVITGVIALLSVFLFFAGHVEVSRYAEIWTEFSTVLTEELGFEAGLFFLYIAAATVLNLVSTPLMYYASIAVGHLFGKHRILGAIVSYGGFYTVMQISATIAMVFMGYRINNADYFMAQIFHGYFLFIMIYSAFFTALFYFLTTYIFTKRLNLE